MPISVNHDERRATVIAVASSLIAKESLESVSVRDIADAAGCSTAIVSHYFRNKRELLLLTYNASIETATERANDSLAAAKGHPKAYLAEIMPLDDKRWTEWRIWIQFWARAAADPEIAAVQRDCVRRTRGNIQAILEAEKERGRIAAQVDCEATARRLLTSIMGMAIQAVYDRKDWSAQAQHKLIDEELARIYGGAATLRRGRTRQVAAE